MTSSYRDKRILIIKTSSMGDIIHTLPALTDAQKVMPNAIFDWCVEESFKDIPRLHPAVDKIIPVSIRRWRRTPWKKITQQQWSQFKYSLQSSSYDYVIDAQGLLKSAYLTRYINTKNNSKSIIGFDRHSIREPLAALFYHTRISVPKDQHAVDRVRLLFSRALGYPMPGQFQGYGINQRQHTNIANNHKPYVLFLHGTTWNSKLWPSNHWSALADLIIKQGYDIKLTFGNNEERTRAVELKQSYKLVGNSIGAIDIIEKSTINTLCGYLQQAVVVISVDSGLGHLAAAFNKPLIALYGPTAPLLTGCYGDNSHNISTDQTYSCLPCFKKECTFTKEKNSDALCMKDLSPNRVFEQIRRYLTPIS